MQNCPTTKLFYICGLRSADRVQQCSQLEVLLRRILHAVRHESHDTVRRGALCVAAVQCNVYGKYQRESGDGRIVLCRARSGVKEL